MDASTVEYFRLALLELQSELQDIEEIAKDASKPVKLDQTMVGRLSRMDAMQGAEMAREASRRRRLQLARIPVALQRINDGDYGFCATCDELIAEGRLKIDPTYAHCVNCADARE
jgi:DnaK suppressor protein